MSTTLIVHCDKCGGRVTENRLCLDVRTGAMRTRRPNLDLCPACADRLQAWLAEKSAAAVDASDELP